MTFGVENETDQTFPFSVEDMVKLVCETVLEQERCPYEAQINVVVTDREGIREMNRMYRGIDRETDVLSFPNLEFQEEGIFDIDEDREADCFDPDTGELVLGDIMVSADRVFEQAKSYGHSVRREFAFLLAHSMLHLCGYDHMEEGQAERMEHRQEEILSGLGITRDELRDTDESCRGKETAGRTGCQDTGAGHNTGDGMADWG